MDYAQRISSLTFALRKKEDLRVRQPLQKIMLPVLDKSFQEQVDQVKMLIASEVNVKDIEYLDDTSGVLKKRIKPNFKTLGRRLGKDMKAAAQQIGSLSQDDIANIEQTGKYMLEANGSKYELTLEDFEITAEDIPGLLVANDGKVTVALDITLTPELEAEGIARDLVNRIQNIRKDSGFEVTDKIKVALESATAVVPAVEQFGDYIMAETLTADLQLVETVTGGQQIELPGEVEVQIQVEKA
jgi:isoleucyl-tRNA synthetase